MGDIKGLRLSEDDYDFGILHPAFRRLYDGSDFYNFGYWRAADGTKIKCLKDAAARMVALHCETDTDSGAVRNVLDVGCGLGACTAAFSRFYPKAHVTGVNYSTRQIAYARDRHASDRMTFEKMDACTLGFADNSFDRIHCVEAAMHFRPRQEFLQEAFRVLVPGGLLVLTDILTDRAQSIIPEENVLPSADAYAAALDAAGLIPVEIRSLRADTVPPFIQVLNANAMQAYARKVDAMAKDYVLVSARKPS